MDETTNTGSLAKATQLVNRGKAETGKGRNTTNPRDSGESGHGDRRRTGGGEEEQAAPDAGGEE